MNSGWGTVRWHSGTHGVHMSDILQWETAWGWRRVGEVKRGGESFSKSPHQEKEVMAPLTTLLGLVWTIAAVAVMVTHEVLGDTLSVLAHELIAAARVVEHCDIKKYLVSESGQKVFIPLQGRYGFMSSFVSLYYVFNLSPALTTASFDALVSPIRTVFISITLPVLRDTHVWSRTLERLRTAGFGLCDGNKLLKVILMPFPLFPEFMWICSELR